MKKIKVFSVCFGILLGFQNVFAQVTRTPPITNPNNPLPDYVYRNEQKRREMDRITGKDENGMIAGRPNGRIPQLRPTRADGKPYTKEELQKMESLLNPNPEDLAKYKDFLQNSNTGLFRMFPDFDCESQGLIRVDGPCENFIPGSWIYSFRMKRHSELDFFDLRLSNEDLIADSFLSQEILVPLGDLPLDNVSLTSAGMKFLNDFLPETKIKEARKQFAQIANVVEADGFRYAKRVRAVANVTYAMRIVAYRPQNNIGLRFGIGLNRDNARYLNDEKRFDVTLAFRIIRKDENGSISIIWKELKRRNAPKIIFAKDERLSDLK